MAEQILKLAENRALASCELMLGWRKPPRPAPRIHPSCVKLLKQSSISRPVWSSCILTQGRSCCPVAGARVPTASLRSTGRAWRLILPLLAWRAHGCRGDDSPHSDSQLGGARSLTLVRLTSARFS